MPVYDVLGLLLPCCCAVLRLLAMRTVLAYDIWPASQGLSTDHVRPSCCSSHQLQWDVLILNDCPEPHAVACVPAGKGWSYRFCRHGAAQ